MPIKLYTHRQPRSITRELKLTHNSVIALLRGMDYIGGKGVIVIPGQREFNFLTFELLGDFQVRDIAEYSTVDDRKIRFVFYENDREFNYCKVETDEKVLFFIAPDLQLMNYSGYHVTEATTRGYLEYRPALIIGKTYTSTVVEPKTDSYASETLALSHAEIVAEEININAIEQLLNQGVYINGWTDEQV